MFISVHLFLFPVLLNSPIFFFIIKLPFHLPPASFLSLFSLLPLLSFTFLSLVYSSQFGLFFLILFNSSFLPSGFSNSCPFIFTSMIFVFRLSLLIFSLLFSVNFLNFSLFRVLTNFSLFLIFFLLAIFPLSPVSHFPLRFSFISSSFPVVLIPYYQTLNLFLIFTLLFFSFPSLLSFHVANFFPSQSFHFFSVFFPSISLHLYPSLAPPFT